MSRKTTSQRLLETAYHEAGHAVMMVQEGFTFEHVTVVPSEASHSEGDHTLGGVIGHEFPEWLAEPEQITTAKRIEVESLVLCKFAGPAAQIYHKRRPYDLEGSWQDFRDAGWLVGFVHGRDNPVAEAYLSFVWTLALHRVSQPKTWLMIEVIAAALDGQKTLTYNEVIETMKIAEENEDDLFQPHWLPSSPTTKRMLKRSK